MVVINCAVKATMLQDKKHITCSACNDLTVLSLLSEELVHVLQVTCQQHCLRGTFQCSAMAAVSRAVVSALLIAILLPLLPLLMIPPPSLVAVCLWSLLQRTCPPLVKMHNHRYQSDQRSPCRNVSNPQCCCSRDHTVQLTFFCTKCFLYPEQHSDVVGTNAPNTLLSSDSTQVQLCAA